MDFIDAYISVYMLMLDIFYIESELEMEYVHVEDDMRQTGEEQKIQNIER